MHGRLKVRTTEEEKERKKKEQALKVKAYRAAMTKIQAKRQLEELDDEMLQISTQVLLRNPDVTTLWNIRRECMQVKAKELPKHELQAACDAELCLTEQCLMVNPKSYNAWHHRCWTLEHSPQADWQRELHLCTKYLKLDERNFHTWDYRRYVVEKAGVSKQQELDFCTEKIKANFSNYSSWHYRSLLLPQLYPYEGDAKPKRPMSEAKLKEELEMVLTAAFTDPNDSSAWFYQRWLLGYSQRELNICAFRYHTDRAVLAFTKDVNANDFKIALLDEKSGEVVEIKNWQALNGTQTDSSWCASNPGADPTLAPYQLLVEISNLKTQKLSLKSYQNNLYYFSPPGDSYVFSGDVCSELQSQLELCESLLDYEPDSKWTLLTSALLMHAIDRERYHTKSLDYLEKLQKLDALREDYYKDLASKWILEKVLKDWVGSGVIPRKLNITDQPQLVTLYYVQYLIIADDVELSDEMQKYYRSTNAFKMVTAKS